MNMAELDDTENNEDPYATLASLFNDTMTCNYQNTVANVTTDSLGCKVTTCVSPQMRPLMDKCADINPTSLNRPKRDGAWIRSHWMDIRNQLTPLINKFKKSGEQQAENIYEEWANFLTNSNIPYGKHIWYVITVMSIHDIFTYSRALPEVYQQNSTMNESLMSHDEAVDQLSKKKAKKGKSVHRSTKDGDDLDMAQVLDVRFKEANIREEAMFQHKRKMDMLSLMLSHGTEKQKRSAREIIAKDLGLPDNNHDDSWSTLSSDSE
jgi:hypothetical protein